MKYFIYILFTFVLSFEGHTPYPKEYEKQINKEVKKLFGKNEIAKRQLDIPDSLKFSDNNSLSGKI